MNTFTIYRTSWDYNRVVLPIAKQDRITKYPETSCKKKVKALKAASRGVCRLPLWSTEFSTNDVIIILLQIKKKFQPFWWEDNVNTFNLQASCKVMKCFWKFGWRGLSLIFIFNALNKSSFPVCLCNAVKHISMIYMPLHKLYFCTT